MTDATPDLSAGHRGRCVPRRSDTARAAAIRYLAKADRWVRTGELCTSFGLRACDIIPALRQAERNGDIQSKDAGHRYLMWRFIPMERPDGKRFLIDWPPMWESRWEEACQAIR